MTRSLSIHDGFARFLEAHYSASKPHSTIGPERRQEHLQNVGVSDRPNRPDEEFRAVSAPALQARETTPNPSLLSSVFV
jgi:hypothetical protein